MAVQNDKSENLMDDLEERANQLLEDTLDLNDAEVDASYNAARPGVQSRQRVLELAERAAALCQAERRQRPPQLEEALIALAQLELPLERYSQALPRVLLIDQDASRLLARHKLFLERHVDTAVTTSLFDGLDQLETEFFNLVIVDGYPSTEEERAALLHLQQFNLRMPVINVAAWADVLRPENRRLNRDLLRAAARLFGKPVPKRLPEKRPPKKADAPPDASPLFNAG